MKKPFRRAGPDRTQSIRLWFQLAFLALNVWIGIQFYLFVRYYETGGQMGVAERPPGVEGWLPIASLMNLKVLLYTGGLPSIHPAGVFLLIAFLLISWLLRKSFCGWLCPVGTASEYLAKLGKKIFGRTFTLPRWLDIPLRSLKYILMGLFLYVIAAMSVEQIRAFLSGPYGIVADVKMLNFFRNMGLTAAAVLGVLVLASVFVQNFWCRYLCPYGALTGLASLLSPVRIHRDKELCIDCAKCARACPSRLPVDTLVQIRSAECLGCMECVNVCPAEGALDLKAFGRRTVRPWMVAAGIAFVFFGFVGYAKATGHWNSNVPNSLYQRLVPNASEFEHPR